MIPWPTREPENLTETPLAIAIVNEQNCRNAGRSSVGPSVASFASIRVAWRRLSNATRLGAFVFLLSSPLLSASRVFSSLHLPHFTRVVPGALSPLPSPPPFFLVVLSPTFSPCVASATVFFPSCIFPTSYFPLPTSHFPLHAACCMLHTERWSLNPSARKQSRARYLPNTNTCAQRGADANITSHVHVLDFFGLRSRSLIVLWQMASKHE